MALLPVAPSGFVAACDTLDDLPPATVTQLATEALAALGHRGPPCPATAAHAALIEAGERRFPLARLQSAQRALEHLFRQARAFRPAARRPDACARAALAAQAPVAALAETLTPYLAPGACCPASH